MPLAKGRLLIFNSMFYPYLHDGVAYDSYADKEIEIIAEQFEKVIVIPHTKPGNGSRKMPANVSLVTVDLSSTLKYKSRALSFVFKKDFIQEIQFYKKINKQQPDLRVLKSLFGSYSVALKYLDLINSIISKEKGKEVFLYSYWLFEFSYAAALIKGKNPLVKAFSRAHSLDIYFERSKINFLSLKLSTAKKLDALFFISSQGCEYFKKAVFNSDKFFVSRLGVCSNQVLNFEGMKRNGKFKIVSNSWVQPLKRIHLLIESLSLIPENIEIEWYHIGEAHKEDYHYEDTVKLAADLLDSKPNITYKFLGTMTPEQIIEFYKSEQINLFINVSSTEGVPVSIMEACSVGIPVISTNVGGVSEIVSNNIGHLLNPNPSPSEVCNAIVDIINLPLQNYFQLCNSSYKKWDADFNAEKNYLKFSEAILRI